MTSKRKEIILPLCSKLVLKISILLGFYIIVHGHLSPGGGFQGGVIVASAIVIYYLANGREKTLNTFNIKRLENTEKISALSFIFIASLGIIYGVPFFTNILSKGIVGSVFSSGSIFFMNFAVGLKVLSGVSVLILVIISSLRGGDERIDN